MLGEARETNAAMPRRLDPAWAWDRYAPDSERPWNLARASHLYRRAALGASWSDIQRALDEGPERTIDRLLRPEADVEAFDRGLDPYEESASRSGSADALRAWWLRRLITSPHPLRETLTLFWHDHFAVSNAGVGDGTLMLRHLRLLREHALGSFASLLRDVSRDPAFLVSLGADKNRKAQPSSHLARSLLEVFTLGKGGFSESDVAEVGRAFTGWFVLRGELRRFEREYDSGTKRVLGREGRFDDRAVVDILLDEPSTARTIVGKLYCRLLSEADEPTEELLEPLVGRFSKDHDTAAVVETMLRSNLFQSELAYRRRIRSPLELAIAIVRAFEATVATTTLGEDLATLGESLLDPPTLRGWPRGRDWIDPFSIAGRSQLAAALLGEGDRYGGKIDPQAVARRHGHEGPENTRRFLVDVLFGGDLPESVRQGLLQADAEGDAALALRRFARLAVTLPEFQLA